MIKSKWKRIKDKGMMVCQKLFPIYTKQLVIVILGIVVVMMVSHYSGNTGQRLFELSRPEHSETSDSVKVYVSSQTYALSDELITLKVDPALPTEEEELSYLLEGEEALINQMEQYFVESQQIESPISYPVKIGKCKVEYNETGWINIGIAGYLDLNKIDQKVETAHTEQSIMIQVPYTISYGQQSKVAYYSVQVDIDKITPEYRKDYGIWSVEEAWTIANGFVEDTKPDLPGIGDVLYMDQQEKPSLGDYLKWLLLLILLFSLITHLEIKEKRKQLQRKKRIQLTYFINNFVLMYQTGLTVQRSFNICVNNRIVTLEKEHEVYDIFTTLQNMIQLDVSIFELVAYLNKAFNLMEGRRFSRLLLQNLKQGDSYLSIQLTKLSDELWTERIRRARKASEKASSKLVMPMVLIFVVIVVLTIVPTFLEVSKL